MTKKELKELDKKIERFYYQHGNGIQIDIMSISKVFADCQKAHLSGQDLEQAVIEAVAKYRLN